MFVNCQNFAASWGHKFVGNWFVTLQCKTIHYFVKCSWGRSFLGKENPRNPPTLPPTPNNDDSTVLHVISVYMFYNQLLNKLHFSNFTRVFLVCFTRAMHSLLCRVGFVGFKEYQYNYECYMHT